MLGDDLLAVLGDAVPGARIAQALADDWIPAIASGRVMDLGCGAGDSVAQFRDVNSGVRWVGVDVERSPEVASRRRTDAEFVTFDGVHLPFDDGSFDGKNIVLWTTPLETEHPGRKTVARAHLEEDGRVLLHRHFLIDDKGEERMIIELRMTKK